MANYRTPSVRCAFVNLFNPRAFGEGATPKYGLTMLLDPGVPKEAEAILELRRQVKAAVEKKFGTDPKNWPLFTKKTGFSWKTYLSDDGRDGFPLRNGDLQQYEGFAGKVSVSLSSVEPIQVLDRSRIPMSGDELKKCRSGNKYSLIVNAYAWEYQKNKGVSFGVQAIMHVLDDGVYWGNSVDGRRAFADFEDDDLEDTGDFGPDEGAVGADDPANYKKKEEDF